MAKFEIIENACDDRLNKYTIKLLKEQGGWRLSPDHYDTKIASDMESTEYAKQMDGFSDTGMLLTSYSGHPDEAELNNDYQNLNTLAEFIFESVMIMKKTFPKTSHM